MGAPLEILELLQHPATEVAPYLLGALLRHESPEGTVVVRLTEIAGFCAPGPRRAQLPRQNEP